MDNQKTMKVYVAGSNAVDHGSRLFNSSVSSDEVEIADAITVTALESVVEPLVECGIAVTVVTGADDGDFNSTVAAWCETKGIKIQKVNLGGLFAEDREYSHRDSHFNGIPSFVLARDQFVGHARKTLAGLALDAALIIPNAEFLLGDNAKKIKRLLVENLGGGSVLPPASVCDFSEKAAAVCEQVDELRDLERRIVTAITAESSPRAAAKPA